MDLCGGTDLRGRALLGAGVDDPLGVVQVELGAILEERQVGLPVGLDRPDVLPVPGVAVAEDPAPPSSIAGTTLPPKSTRCSSASVGGPAS